MNEGSRSLQDYGGGSGSTENTSQDSNKDQIEHKDEYYSPDGPTLTDLWISFTITLVLLLIAWLLAVKFKSISPFSCILLISGLVHLVALFCPTIGNLNWFGKFGRRLWSFSGLWYVVLLVGLYNAAYSAINQHVQSLLLSSALNFESLISKLSQDILLATFLAVLTSILSHAFSHVGDLTNKLNVAIEGSQNANKIIKGTSDDVINMSKTIKSLFNKLTNISESIHTSLTASRTAQRSYSISVAANDLKKEEGKKVVGEAIQRMCDELESYHDVALHPILFPGILPPEGNQETDTVLQVAKRMKDNSDELPHYAYMATAIGRYFEAESMERHFPGVILNVTSYTYYIRTIQAIVDALAPWYDRYHFYTLMPKCPIELFRFSDSTDIVDWREFMVGYKKFQLSEKGIWKRYFAFSENVKNSKGFVDRHTIRNALNRGWVLTDNKDGLPRIVESKENIENLFPQGIKGNLIKNDFLKNNSPHIQGGSCTLADICDDLSKFEDWPQLRSKGWRQLKEVLLDFHGLTLSDNDNKVGERFVFRNMDDWNNVFKNKILIESRSVESSGIKEKKMIRSFDFPVDFFAIQDTKAVDGEKWIFLIGLDDDYHSIQKASISLEFAPVLDLATMANVRSGTINNKTALEIRHALDVIFLESSAVVNYKDI